jgi:hypothetical protein
LKQIQLDFKKMVQQRKTLCLCTTKMWIFEVRQKPHFGDVKSNFDVRGLAILLGVDVLDFWVCGETVARATNLPNKQQWGASSVLLLLVPVGYTAALPANVYDQAVDASLRSPHTLSEADVCTIVRMAMDSEG